MRSVPSRRFIPWWKPLRPCIRRRGYIEISSQQTCSSGKTIDWLLVILELSTCPSSESASPAQTKESDHVLTCRHGPTWAIDSKKWTLTLMYICSASSCGAWYQGG